MTDIPLPRVITAVPLRSEAETSDQYEGWLETFLDDDITGFSSDLATAIPVMNTNIATVNSQSAQVEEDADAVDAAKTVIEAMYADIINSTSTAAVGTSTASVAIGTGSKSFAAGAGTVGKAWPLNQPVFAVSSSDPTKSMWGELTAYNAADGSFTMNSQTVAGSGTVASWVIYLSLPRFMIAPNVVVATKTDTASTTSTSWVDTGLEVSITLKKASDKVLVSADVMGSETAVGSNLAFRFVRGGTPLLQGDAAGTRTQAHFGMATQFATELSGANSIVSPASGSAVDTPGSAGPHTYKLQWSVRSGTGYMNRAESDADGAFRIRGASTLTAMEIA